MAKIYYLVVLIDEHLNEILNIVDDVECTDDIPNYFKLKQNNILQRCNKDRGRVNKYGTKLVDFCKRCNLLIANGRLFSDKSVGRTTCKDASMVDYLLLSPNIINIITDFEIIDFNPMFSDVHNRVHLTLTGEGENNQQSPIDNPNMNPRVRWRSQDSNILLKSHFLHIYILCTITSYGIKYILMLLKPF